MFEENVQNDTGCDVASILVTYGTWNGNSYSIDVISSFCSVTSGKKHVNYHIIVVMCSLIPPTLESARKYSCGSETQALICNLEPLNPTR